MIYFIQCESTHLIKIGFTDGDPEHRLSALQTGSPAGLRLLFSMPGERAKEKELHAQFAANRDRGEWFRPTPDVLAFVLQAATSHGFAVGRTEGRAARKRRYISHPKNWPLKIYLAGKISKNCWRHTIVKGLQDVNGLELVDNFDARNSWPVLEKSIFGEHHYVGPYFAQNGHANAHGDDSHGLIGDDFEAQNYRSTEIIECCLDAVENSDLVFAYIDSLDCYGTITEIGYAVAAGKTVTVCGPRHFRDMWFVNMLASEPVFNSKPPAEILAEQLQRFRSYQQMDGQLKDFDKKVMTTVFPK